jgi:hypothetical protein
MRISNFVFIAAICIFFGKLFSFDSMKAFSWDEVGSLVFLLTFLTYLLRNDEKSVDEEEDEY